MQINNTHAVATNFANIVAAINATNGVVQDDHRQGGWIKVTGIGHLVRSDKIVPVLFCKSAYFSLNLLYLGTDGEARVSRDSVGGVVKLFDAPLADALKQYNENQAENIFTASFLTDIHFLVDDQLVAQDLVTPEKLAALQARAKAAHDQWNTQRKQA